MHGMRSFANDLIGNTHVALVCVAVRTTPPFRLINLPEREREKAQTESS
jgi:hypothetical protein